MDCNILIYSFFPVMPCYVLVIVGSFNFRSKKIEFLYLMLSLFSPLLYIIYRARLCGIPMNASVWSLDKATLSLLYIDISLVCTVLVILLRTVSVYMNEALKTLPL